MFDIFGTVEWRHGCGMDRYTFEEVVMVSPSSTIFFIITACATSTLHVALGTHTSHMQTSWYYTGVQYKHTSCHSHQNWLDSMVFFPGFSMESCLLCLWIHSFIFSCETCMYTPHVLICSYLTSNFIACIKEDVSWYRATRSLPLFCINLHVSKRMVTWYDCA